MWGTFPGTALAPITSAAETAAGAKTVTYENLKPTETYNFYSMKYKSANNPLSSNNLLCIRQFTTDENGCATITYKPDEEYTTPTEFVTAMSRTSIREADLTMPAMSYNGQQQYVSPLLIYQEQRLIEGRDYELSGTYKACEVGDYSFTIIGKGTFAGSI